MALLLSLLNGHEITAGSDGIWWKKDKKINNSFIYLIQ